VVTTLPNSPSRLWASCLDAKIGVAGVVAARDKYLEFDVGFIAAETNASPVNCRRSCAGKVLNWNPFVVSTADDDGTPKEIAMQHLTLNQKTRIKAKEERRRLVRRRRAEEYRRRIQRLRRQIEEARKRRQLMLLLLLFAILAIQESILAAYQRSYLAWSVSDADSLDWIPDPTNDFAPRHGSDDYCDGYSREQWELMTGQRGIRLSRKAELKKAWEADPDWERFPERYQQWGYRPFLGELLNDLSQLRYRSDALVAVKLSSPREVHRYIEEAVHLNPADLRQCFEQRDRDIVAALQMRAILWAECKRRDAEEARRNKEFRKKIDDDPDGPSLG
jgi:ribosomal protein S30